ncbi:hypothetical protein VitviT2T_004053 [Vitis vinifera]|uniref:Uncharacterized protein n=1 Tax=Vitis vinifera TaxID=29760 RepID=A0ABY9BNU9_VITVI|nr:hypothetical protein VitviT2T_004053 [Vitis vinifera]
MEKDNDVKRSLSFWIQDFSVFIRLLLVHLRKFVAVEKAVTSTISAAPGQVELPFKLQLGVVLWSFSDTISSPCNPNWLYTDASPSTSPSRSITYPYTPITASSLPV